MSKKNCRVTREQQKSVRIIFPTWKKGRAHCAHEPLKCAGYGCKQVIGVGELYTRHKPASASYHYSVHPFCQSCVPFVVAERSSGELIDEYLRSPFGLADKKTWQEKYGHHPVLGPSIRIVEVQEE